MGWDRGDCCTLLVDINDAIAFLNMLEQLLLGIKALCMDSCSVLSSYNLGLPDLLLGDPMLMIYFAKII